MKMLFLMFSLILLFNGNLLAQTFDVILTGEAAEDFFGTSVSIAGDVNGDGIQDVIVGALQNDAGGDGAGRRDHHP